LAVLSIMVCSAAWSICLSADEPALEPGREVPSDMVGVEAVCVDGVGTVSDQESNNDQETRDVKVTAPRL
jgi:hypothetical protein